MFHSEPVAEQINRAADSQRPRILVVGAGVAGLTLAQLLALGGIRAVLLERAADHRQAGYMLALARLIEPAVQQLGLSESYHRHSVTFEHYWLHGHRGRRLRNYRFSQLMGGAFDYRGITRGDLLKVLSGRGQAISYGATVKDYEQRGTGVRVDIAHGEGAIEADFDAVIFADGVRSQGRARMLAPAQIQMFDAHWGGWVAWDRAAQGLEDRGAELWGANFFLGVYPVQGKMGVILLGHNVDTASGPRSFIAYARQRIRHWHPWMESALRALEAQCAAEGAPYYWHMADYRSAEWARGRVALVGDAAAAFLPTAGIGAAMAMESATILARRLTHTAAGDIPAALQDYERVQKPRVEAAQRNSRQLSKLAFVRNTAWATLRDGVARFIPMKTALGPILRLLETQPE